jgi:uncharacterized protein YuzB (UPF0349 family)
VINNGIDLHVKGVRMRIRLCEHNKGATKVYKKLKEAFPRMDVKMKDCIKKCGPCHKTMFAVVDGKTVCAIDAEELFKKIVAEME